MNEVIVKFDIENELDIVMAHKTAIQIAEFTGLNASDQTHFATTISEVSRNCLEFSIKGNISFFIEKKEKKYRIVVKISHKGPEIAGLKNMLSALHTDNAEATADNNDNKKLVDFFEIASSEKDAIVILGIHIPDKHPPITKLMVNNWADYFKNEVPVSPYEEIKKRNARLLELSNELKLKKMETEFQLEENKRLTNLLEQKNENLRQLTYLIVHDIRNPLSIIRLCCEMYDNSGSGEEKTEFINMINRNADRILNITEELRSNMDQDMEMAINTSKANIKDIIKNLEKQFSAYLDKVDGSITTSLQVTEFYYPEVYLYSIFTNLITNSIKYSSKQPLSINIKTEKKDTYVQMEFIDNGIGINLKKHKKNLFKPFNRFIDKGEGKGVGLSIISHLVSKNGGKLEIESELGKGCKFILQLNEYKGN